MDYPQTEKARGFDEAPFAWAIRECHARLRQGDAAAPGHHRTYIYVERGFYAAQLARAHALFGADNVLSLRSEDLPAQPAEAVGRVSRFLEVEAPAAVEPLRANVGVERDLGSTFTDEDRVLLAGLYREDLAEFSRLSGLDVTKWAEAP